MPLDRLSLKWIEGNTNTTLSVVPAGATYNVDNPVMWTPLSVMSGLASGFCERRAALNSKFLTAAGTTTTWVQGGTETQQVNARATIVRNCMHNMAAGITNMDQLFYTNNATMQIVGSTAPSNYMTVMDNAICSLITGGTNKFRTNIAGGTYGTTDAAAFTALATAAQTRAHAAGSDIILPEKSGGATLKAQFGTAIPVEWAKERKWMLDELRFTRNGTATGVKASYLYSWNFEVRTPGTLWIDEYQDVSFSVFCTKVWSMHDTDYCYTLDPTVNEMGGGYSDPNNGFSLGYEIGTNIKDDSNHQVYRLLSYSNELMYGLSLGVQNIQDGTPVTVSCFLGPAIPDGMYEGYTPANFGSCNVAPPGYTTVQANAGLGYIIPDGATVHFQSEWWNGRLGYLDVRSGGTAIFDDTINAITMLNIDQGGTILGATNGTVILPQNGAYTSADVTGAAETWIYRDHLGVAWGVDPGYCYYATTGEVSEASLPTNTKVIHVNGPVVAKNINQDESYDCGAVVAGGTLTCSTNANIDYGIVHSNAVLVYKGAGPAITTILSGGTMHVKATTADYHPWKILVYSGGTLTMDAGTSVSSLCVEGGGVINLSGTNLNNIITNELYFGFFNPLKHTADTGLQRGGNTFQSVVQGGTVHLYGSQTIGTQADVFTGFSNNVELTDINDYATQAYGVSVIGGHTYNGYEVAWHISSATIYEGFHPLVCYALTQADAGVDNYTSFQLRQSSTAPST